MPANKNMEIFSLIVRLIEFLKDFLVLWAPLKYCVVVDGQLGVKYRFGKVIKNLDPGIHFGTSGEIFQVIDSKKIKSNVNQCENFTKDLIPIRVYGNYTYDIIDAGQYLTKSEDSSWLLVEVVEQEIFDWFSNKTFNESHFKVMDGSFSIEVAERVNKRCEELELGINVLFVRVSDWQVLDSAVRRALTLDTIINVINKYESPDPYLVGLLVGSQPVMDYMSHNENETES